MAMLKPIDAPARRTRQQQSQERREKLLDAAWSLLLEKGYQALSLDTISEQAGCTRMPVYNLFGSKQALFVALWIRQLDSHLTGSVLFDGPQNITLEQALRQRAHEIGSRIRSAELAALGELATLLLSLSRADATLRDVIRKRQRATAQLLAARVEGFVARSGEQLCASPEEVAHALLRHVNGVVMIDLIDPADFDSERVADQLVRLALKTT